MDTTFFTLFGAVHRTNKEFVDRLLQPHGVRVGQQLILQLLCQAGCLWMDFAKIGVDHET